MIAATLHSHETTISLKIWNGLHKKRNEPRHEKTGIYLCENKGANQLCSNCAFVFATRIIQFRFFLNPKSRQVLHTPGPEMCPGMCPYCFTLKTADLIIFPVFIRASNFGTRSMKYEGK